VNILLRQNGNNTSQAKWQQYFSGKMATILLRQNGNNTSQAKWQQYFLDLLTYKHIIFNSILTLH
jgi:uncharacterized protein YneF (UPF0154 family)